MRTIIVRRYSFSDIDDREPSTFIGTRDHESYLFFTGDLLFRTASVSLGSRGSTGRLIQTGGKVET